MIPNIWEEQPKSFLDNEIRKPIFVFSGEDAYDLSDGGDFNMFTYLNGITIYYSQNIEIFCYSVPRYFRRCYYIYHLFDISLN